jgi:hypothetical protein
MFCLFWANYHERVLLHLYINSHLVSYTNRKYYITWMLCCYSQPQLVPHSQWSLRENPKFLQNDILKEKFWIIFLFNICHCDSGLAFNSKNYYIVAQNCVYFITENSQKLRQQRKWDLWMYTFLWSYWWSCFLSMSGTSWLRSSLPLKSGICYTIGFCWVVYWLIVYRLIEY